MQTTNKLPFLTMILLISFASVNAVLFTPALPDISNYFAITHEMAQYTISWFLIGYALGQLIYGPLASRYGRKQAITMGITLAIVASFGCVAAGIIHEYSLLVFSRFLLALGSGVGLKMTFTLVNECYEPKVASQKIAYLMLAFAITPGIGVAIGGVMNAHFGWMSCFIIGAIYAVALLYLTLRLPIIEPILDQKALQWSHLQKAYCAQLSNHHLLAGGLLMGGSTCFVYLFAALAPFIAMNQMGMSSEEYGLANILPAIGLMIGSIFSAKMAKKHSLGALIKFGLMLSATGTVLMGLGMGLSLSPLLSLFLPMLIIYMGLSFILANASSLAMGRVEDKAHGSAVMSFINMGFATVMVLSMGCFTSKTMLLPMTYLALCVVMVPMYRRLIR